MKDLTLQDLMLNGCSIVNLVRSNDPDIEKNNKRIIELKEEIKRLQKENAELESITKETKQKILDAILKKNLKSLEFNGYKFTAKKNPGKVIVVDKDKIPEKYMKVEVVKTPDAKHIKEDYKKNNILADGCMIEESFTLLITEKEEGKLGQSDFTLPVVDDEEDYEL